jgi:hypothetical protein
VLYDGNTTTSFGPIVIAQTRFNFEYANEFIPQTLLFRLTRGAGSPVIIQTDLYAFSNSQIGIYTVPPINGTLLASYQHDWSGANSDFSYNMSVTNYYKYYCIYLTYVSGSNSVSANTIALTNRPTTYIPLSYPTDYTITTGTDGLPYIDRVSTLTSDITVVNDRLLCNEAYNRLYPVVRSKTQVSLNTGGTTQYNITGDNSSFLIKDATTNRNLLQTTETYTSIGNSSNATYLYFRGDTGINPTSHLVSSVLNLTDTIMTIACGIKPFFTFTYDLASSYLTKLYTSLTLKNNAIIDNPSIDLIKIQMQKNIDFGATASSAYIGLDSGGINSIIRCRNMNLVGQGYEHININYIQSQHGTIDGTSVGSYDVYYSWLECPIVVQTNLIKVTTTPYSVTDLQVSTIYPTLNNGIVYLPSSVLLKLGHKITIMVPAGVTLKLGPAVGDTLNGTVTNPSTANFGANGCYHCVLVDPLNWRCH